MLSLQGQGQQWVASDRDCEWGSASWASFFTLESHEERQRAYLIRRQWIRLIKQITEKPVPQQRVQKIIEQFEQYFDSKQLLNCRMKLLLYW